MDQINGLSYLWLSFIALYTKYSFYLLSEEDFELLINRYIIYKNSGGKRINKDMESILKSKNNNINHNSNVLLTTPDLNFAKCFSKKEIAESYKIKLVEKYKYLLSSAYIKIIQVVKN